MKRILGLDLGTNSIGWALVEQDFEKKAGNILGLLRSGVFVFNWLIFIVFKLSSLKYTIF